MRRRGFVNEDASVQKNPLFSCIECGYIESQIYEAEIFPVSELTTTYMCNVTIYFYSVSNCLCMYFNITQSVLFIKSIVTSRIGLSKVKNALKYCTMRVANQGKISLFLISKY